MSVSIKIPTVLCVCPLPGSGRWVLDCTCKNKKILVKIYFNKRERKRERRWRARDSLV